MSTRRKTLVFGPAYLDRVLKVDRPLVDPSLGGVIDRSAPGRWEDVGGRSDLLIIGLTEGDIRVELPPDWPGPVGKLRVGPAGEGGGPRTVRGDAWHDDLGGMGAGFARALGGTLHLPLGDDADPVNHRILGLLAGAGIDCRPLRVPGRVGEWTLLLTSGEYGDKLPIGFRDPGTFDPIGHTPDEPCDLLVAASMTNRRAAAALAIPSARVRLFAPAMRNMTDTDPKVSAFTKDIDILCCNRTEWETLADREEVAWRVPILSITDGPRGAEVRYTTPTGEAGRLEIPAFPRTHPPRDTNRAGEAFASTFVTSLLDAGWSPDSTPDDLIRLAAVRASAASALVLDRAEFGFPTDGEIERALREGIVQGGPAQSSRSWWAGVK